MADLLQLAERCEKATGPERELDEEIAAVVAGAIREVQSDGRTAYHVGTRWVSVPVELYTAFVDAALTLVPEGWTVANLSQSDSKGWWAELRQGYLTSYDRVAFGNQLENANPALALCAAALRARQAAQTPSRIDGLERSDV